jgi:hypothetical protein
MTLTDRITAKPQIAPSFHQRPQAHVLANSNNQIMNTQRVRHTDCSYPFKPMALTHTDLFWFTEEPLSRSGFVYS